MPKAQYRVPTQGLELTAAFPTPKRMGEMAEWIRAAAEAMPDAEAFRKGRPGTQSRYVCGEGWVLSDSGASERMVSFEFINGEGVRAYLVIDRTFGTVGARV